MHPHAQVLFGVARLTDHHPGDRWLLAWANEFAPHMRHAHPAVLVEVLLSLVSLQFQPTQRWMGNMMKHLSRGLLQRRGKQGKGQYNSVQQPVQHSQREEQEQGALPPGLERPGLDRVHLQPPHLLSPGSLPGADAAIGGSGSDDDVEALMEWEEEGDEEEEEGEGEPEAWDGGPGGEDRRPLGRGMGSGLNAAGARQPLTGAGEEEEGEQEGEDFLASDYADATDPYLEGEDGDLQGIGRGSEDDDVDHSIAAISQFLDNELTSVSAPDLLKLLEQGRPRPAKSAGTSQASPRLPLPNQTAQQQQQQQQAPPLVLSRYDAWRLGQRKQLRLHPAPLTPSHLAQLAWCLDSLDYLPDPEWMSAFVTRAEACLPRAGSAELADLLQGLAGIDFLPDDEFMAVAATRMQLLATGMTAEPLRRCLRALSRLGFRPPKACLDAMVARAGEVVSELGPLGLPDVLLAATYLSGSFSSSGSHPHQSQQPQEEEDGGEQPQEEGGEDQPVLEALSGRARSASAAALVAVQPRVRQGPKAARGSLDSRWVESFLRVSLPLLPACPADRLASLGWSLALLQSHAGMEGIEEEGARATAPPRPSPEWLHEWLVCCRSKLKQLDARDLATVAWASACLRHRPGPAWLEDYAREAGRRLVFFDAQVGVQCGKIATPVHQGDGQKALVFR